MYEASVRTHYQHQSTLIIRYLSSQERSGFRSLGSSSIREKYRIGEKVSLTRKQGDIKANIFAVRYFTKYTFLNSRKIGRLTIVGQIKITSDITTKMGLESKPYLALFILQFPERQFAMPGTFKRLLKEKKQPRTKLIRTLSASSEDSLSITQLISNEHFSLKFSLQTLKLFRNPESLCKFLKQTNPARACAETTKVTTTLLTAGLLKLTNAWLICLLNPPNSYITARQEATMNPKTTWSKLCPPKYILEAITKKIIPKPATAIFRFLLLLKWNKYIKKIKTANSVCPLGLPQSLGQQQPMFLMEE